MFVTRIRRWLTGSAGDQGVTVLEVSIGMVIMSFFMVIFTTGIVQMFRSASDYEATQASQSRLNLAFERLDEEIRYARRISTPVTDSTGAWFVEYQNTNKSPATCTQLRLKQKDNDWDLQRRTWPSGTVPQPGRWTTVAAAIKPAASANPFAVSATTSRLQQLTLTLAARYATSGKATEIRDTTFFFVARNSTATDSTNSQICSEGRGVS